MVTADSCKLTMNASSGKLRTKCASALHRCKQYGGVMDDVASLTWCVEISTIEVFKLTAEIYAGLLLACEYYL